MVVNRLLCVKNTYSGISILSFCNCGINDDIFSSFSIFLSSSSSSFSFSLSVSSPPIIFDPINFLNEL